MKVLLVGATPAMSQVIQAAIAQSGAAVEVIEVDEAQAAVIAQLSPSTDLGNGVDAGEIERLFESGKADHEALLSICTALGVPAGADMHVDGPALANSLRNLLHHQDKLLAKKDALLQSANYVVEAARAIDKEAFAKGTQNVNYGLYRGLGVLLEQYDVAVSSSAEREKAS